MIVRDLTKRNFVRFEEIDVGEVFKYEGYIYLKISFNFDPGIANAFDVINNRKWEIKKGTDVVHVPSELILYGEESSMSLKELIEDKKEC